MGFSHVIPELFLKMYKSKNYKVEIKSPNHKRTFCFIQDAIEMIYKLSSSKNSINKTFNIGSFDKSISILKLAKTMSKLVDKKIKLITSENEVGSPKNRQPSMSEFKKLINYEQKYSLENGLKITYDWYLKNIFKNNKKTFI